MGGGRGQVETVRRKRRGGKGEVAFLRGRWAKDEARNWKTNIVKKIGKNLEVEN